jgi:hypothetical protein
MQPRFDRLRLGTQFAILLAALAASLAVLGSVIATSIVEMQVVSEARSIADMTEHIGKWASQYGGVHVKSAGATGARKVGSYLERSMYARSEEDNTLLTGAQLVAEKDIVEASKRVEEYYWKNPALIQREVSDVASASNSKAQFRITAATVLNPRNAPDAFEKAAISVIETQYAAQPPARPTGGAPQPPPPRLEHWRVEGNQMRYARAIVAVDSCLRCHGDVQGAPKFLLANAEFNGGGGFGYQSGKPAGIISVKIPVPNASQAIASALSPAGWAALAGIAITVALLIAFVIHKVIVPVNRLRRHAEMLSNSTAGDTFDVPAFRVPQNSANEVHRLALAVGELGESVRILFRKVRESRM